MPVAINRHYQGKLANDAPLSVWAHFNNSFTNGEYDPEELMMYVGTPNRHPFCAPHAPIRRKEVLPDGTVTYGSARCRANWLPTNMLAIDIDYSGLEMMNFVNQYGEGWVAAAYETVSSTPEAPRFRLVFRVDRIIQRSDNYQRALAAMIARFSGVDPTSIDIVKAYGGGKNGGEVYVNPVAFIKLEHLIEIIEKREAALREQERRRRRQRLEEASLQDDRLRVWSANEVADMLSVLPDRGDYGWWCKVVFAVYSIFPNDIGIRLLENKFETKKNEIANMFRSLDRHGVRIGPNWLVSAARIHGWKPPKDELVERYYKETMRNAEKIYLRHRRRWVRN